MESVREPVTAAKVAAHREQVIAELACSLTQAASEPEAAARAKALGKVATRFAATGVDFKAIAAVADEARRQFSRDAPSLGLGASRLASPAAPTLEAGNAPPNTDEVVATLVGQTRIETVPTATVVETPREVAAVRRAILAAGVQDITQTLAGDFVLNDVLRIILETAYRAIGFRRVLLFIRDPRSNEMKCRLGLGADAGELIAAGFGIPLTRARDLFAAALTEGADICISDIDAERIRDHVPAWFRARIRTRGLVLFPILVNKRAVGLMYADSDEPAMLAFDPEELNLLKTLRNQAVLAVRTRA
jgi:hypothetical protein